MKKITLLTLTLLVISLASWAQRTVTGVVKDTDGNTLPGVNVTVKGTVKGTITNTEGKYTIKVAEEDSVLVFSFVSYAKEEKVIGDKSTIDVLMLPDIEALSEVVVIGYGVQKKSLVTGAISKVDADDLEKNQLRVESALQGKTAGVQIMQESGSPGGGVTMRIRGTGTDKDSNPLFIVDGMRTDGIEYLNPNDIESVEILKDAASAAIYGADAANGVVLITTKTGGKKVSSLTYSANYGVQEVRKMNEVLNAQEYATYYREGLRHEIISQYPGIEIPEELITIRQDNKYPFNPDTLGTGTDWLGEIFSPAKIQEHNISISGGNEKTSYFLSGSYLGQEGIVGGDKSTFDRFTTRLNASHEVFDWMEIGTKVSYTHFERKSIGENNEFGGVISNAMNIDPITPLYFSDTSQFPNAYLNQILQNMDDIENSSLSAGENGYYGMSTLVQNEIVNPVAQIANTHNQWYTDKVLGGVHMTLYPIDGLSVRTAYDIDLAYGNQLEWQPEYYYHSINYDYLSSMYQAIYRWYTWQWETVATYRKNILDHNFTAMLGNTMRDYSYYYMGGFGEGLSEESWNFAVLDAVLSDSTKNAATGNRNQDNRLLSYFGRINYDYKDRYMLGFTLRADASSKLPAENRTQYFPSVSVGWVATQENFWNFDPINFLKLRFSWGQNGNIRSLDNFAYTTTIATSPQSSYYLSGGTTLVGAEPTRLSNPDLIWETSEQTNLGLDIRFFRDRLSFSTDLYMKETKGLITKAAVPEYVGNTKPLANAGNVMNKGIELELSYKGTGYGVDYNIAANASYNKNEVTELNTPVEGANLGTSGTITRTQEGYPIYYIYGFEAEGVFDSFEEIEAYVNDDGELIQPDAIPGDIKFADLNNDGVINEDDKTMIGNPHPDWTYGFTTNLEYRGFDLKIFFQGTIGNDIYYGAYRTDVTNNNKPYFLYENAWTPDNHTDEFPRYVVNDNNNNFSHNSLFVFDGSYMRLQNLELGYSFKTAMLKKAFVEKLRLYISAQNLFVVTNYPGADPEVGNSDGTTTKASIGIDRGLYPRPRIISFGLNVTL